MISVRATDRMPARRFLPLALILFAIVTAAALALRLPQLARRPLHTDEAVHAVKLGELLETGLYVYDPHEYHGPILYYLNVPILLAGGHTTLADVPDAAWLRIVPVLIGAGVVAAAAMLRQPLGWGAIWAALLLAVSPAMVYYSRYYIQEIALVFFTLVAIAALHRWWTRGRPCWMLLGATSLGLAMASKETWLLTAGALVGALVLESLRARLAGDPLPRPAAPRPLRHAAAGIAVAFGVAVLLLSSFLARPAAAGELFSSYFSYIDRGLTGDSSGGAPATHHHPWTFYLRLLIFFRSGPGPWWSEAAIPILALIGTFFVFSRRWPLRSGLGRVLAFYLLLLGAVMSIIPYKTPWLVLNLLLPMALLGGVGARGLLLAPHRIVRVAAVAVLSLAVLHLAVQSRRATGLYEADTRNPYVYAHTAPAYPRLVRRIEQITGVAPAGREMLIRVIVPGGDYWPLPWDLRCHTRVGYWNSPPDEADAEMVIASADYEETLDALLRRSYMKEYYSLRLDALLVVYIRMDLWESFLQQQSDGPVVP